MCGIIYARSRGRHVNKLIMKRYEAQKSRGSDGFGFVSLDNGFVKEHILEEKEHDIRKFVKDKQTHEMLFHHRLPTSTDNLREAAHPIEVNNDTLKYKYFLAHNGVIQNSKELYEKHTKLGFVYTTEIKKETRIITRNRHISSYKEIAFNDSESLAIELARFIEGFTTEIGTRGSAAFVLLQVEKDTDKLVNIFFGRNEGNPLNIEKNKEFFVLKSSSQNGEEIPSNKIFVLNPNKDEMSVFKEIDIGYYYSYKPSYSSNTKNYGDDYKRNNMGFKQEDKKQYTLEWGDDKIEDNVGKVIHLLPGDSEHTSMYEDQLNRLESDKKMAQDKLKEITAKIVSLTEVKNNDVYFELLQEREDCSEEIREIQEKIDIIYNEFYDNYS